MCNAFGKTSEQYASFQCGDCKRLQPLTALDSDLHGLAVAEENFRAVSHKFFCIDEEECEKVQHPRRIMLRRNASSCGTAASTASTGSEARALMMPTLRSTYWWPRRVGMLMNSDPASSF